MGPERLWDHGVQNGAACYLIKTHMGGRRRSGSPAAGAEITTSCLRLCSPDALCKISSGLSIQRLEFGDSVGFFGSQLRVNCRAATPRAAPATIDNATVYQVFMISLHLCPNTNVFRAPNHAWLAWEAIKKRWRHAAIALQVTLPAGFIAPCLPTKTQHPPGHYGCMKLSTTAFGSSPVRSVPACGSIAVQAMT
jgi:hypothetical protein